MDDWMVRYQEADDFSGEFVRNVLERERFEQRSVEDSSFFSCRFLECELEKVHFSHVEFRDCDFSNSRFFSCGFHQCRFFGCKAMGTQFAQCTFRNCRITDSMFRMSAFSAGKLLRTVLENSDFRSAVFADNSTKELEILHCVLAHVELEHNPWKGVDLTTDEIVGLRAAPSDLAGVRVDLTQAAMLAQLFGLIVKEFQENDKT